MKKKHVGVIAVLFLFGIGVYFLIWASVNDEPIKVDQEGCSSTDWKIPSLTQSRNNRKS